MWNLSRRAWLRATGLGSLAGSVVGGARLAGQSTAAAAPHPRHDAHRSGDEEAERQLDPRRRPLQAVHREERRGQPPLAHHVEREPIVE